MKWLAFLPVSIAFDLICFPAALVLPFACDDDGWLPWWLWWFQTPDNSCDGDAGHVERMAGASTWWRRARWLLRNRGYGFQCGPIGARVTAPVDVYGDTAVGNHPLVEGWVWRVANDGYWMFYGVWRNPLVPTRCVRIVAGWALWGDHAHPTFGMFKFAVNPLMGFTGEV